MIGSIFIDDKEAISALNKTEKKAKTTGETIGGMAKTAGKVGAAVVGMGTVAVGALVGIATKSAGAGDRVDKMSQKIGMSAKGFQEWDYILSQSGASIDSLGVGMKTMAAGIEKPTEDSIKAFKAIGLSVEELSGMSQEQAFETVVKGLQGMDEGLEKTRTASVLLGKQGQELMPLLNSEADSIENLKKNANDLGMVMSDDAVKGAASMTDAMDNIKRAAGGLMNNLGGALMPVLNKVIDAILENMPMIMNLFDKLAPILGEVFDKLLPPLVDLMETLLPPILDLIMELMPVLGEIMDSIMPVIINLLEMLLPPLIEIIQMILPLLLKLIKPLLPLLQPILALLQPFIDLLMMIIEPLVEILDLILPPLIDLLVLLMNKILPVLTDVFKFLADAIGGGLKNAFNGIKPIIENIKNVFNGLISFVKNVFTGNWKGAWENIKNIFSNVFNGLKNAFKIPINWIIDGLNKFIGAIGKIKIPNWVPVVGGKGFALPKIPRLEVGMDYVPYDDFPALLHKGERVMTAEENKRSTVSGNTRIEIPVIMNGREVARAIVDNLDEALDKKRGRVFA